MSTDKDRGTYVLLEEGSEVKRSASTRKDCPKSVSFLLLTLGFCLSLAGSAVLSGYKSGYLQIPDIAALAIHDILFPVGWCLDLIAIVLIARSTRSDLCWYAVTLTFGYFYLVSSLGIFINSICPGLIESWIEK